MTHADNDEPSPRLPRRAVARALAAGMRRDRMLGLVAGGLGAAAAAAFVVLWYALTPATLTIAVAGGDPDIKVIRAFAETLAQRGAGVRLKVRAQETAADAAHALQSGKADLAVVRTDVNYPGNGGTVAILRERSLLLAAPGADVESLRDVKGPRIGVLAHDPADAATLSAMLTHFDYDSAHIDTFDTRQQAVEAFAGGRIGALATLTQTGDREGAALMRELSQASPGGVSILPVDEAAALESSFPYLAATEIPASAFGGRPAMPAEALKTVAVSFRLVASFAADRRHVADIAERLFAARVRIARTAPQANLMKAPDTDEATSALLPNHPGAIDYFEREQKTFMDRWGDLIWLGLFGVGGASSALAWLARFFMRKRRIAVDNMLERVTGALGAAHAALSADELDAQSLALDGLVIEAMAQTTAGHTSARDLSAMILATDAARAAIARKRLALEKGLHLETNKPAELRALIEKTIANPVRRTA
ncbi:MAG: TRAP-type uncharacterized transport system periplasmic component-like protein [Hyphomicrobiales bacterium]|nr:TRAP-type uncharacterized transport system periplasmic component-like protein [Hyphomicrobiales bacterium]